MEILIGFLKFLLGLCVFCTLYVCVVTMGPVTARMLGLGGGAEWIGALCGGLVGLVISAFTVGIPMVMIGIYDRAGETNRLLERIARNPALGAGVAGKMSPDPMRAMPVMAVAPDAENGVEARLGKLKALHGQGIIGDEEHLRRRQEILQDI